MAKYRRECKVCKTTEGLKYVYTRTPSPWDGGMYCTKHRPRMEYDKEPKPQRAQVRRDTKAKGRRAKRRDAPNVHDAPTPPHDGAEQVLGGTTVQLGNDGYEWTSVVRRGGSDTNRQRKKRVRSDRPGAGLPRPAQSAVEAEEADIHEQE